MTALMSSRKCGLLHSTGALPYFEEPGRKLQVLQGKGATQRMMAL